MRTTLLRFWIILNIIRTIPALLVLKFSNSKDIVENDVKRWIKEKQVIKIEYPLWYHFHLFMLNFPEFRNVFYYRISKKHNIIVTLFLKLFYRPLNSLFISAEHIGEGLYIQHGFSTIIAAKSIGKNCSINQQVTIGYNGTENPVIGDNVLITAGAKVIGDVKLGSNIKVGANCVVVKDVPDNCTVIGVPSRIVKLNGEKVDIAI